MSVEAKAFFDGAKCGTCKNWYSRHEMCRTYEKWGEAWEWLNICHYCRHDKYFFEIAQYRCRNIWKVYAGDKNCPKDLVEIEMTMAKIRYVLMGKDPTYVTFKKQTKMITNVTNSAEMRQALNENLHALIMKRRKLLTVREVNNTLGKILTDVKMEMLQNTISGNQQPISWFEKKSIALPVSKEKKQLKRAS